MDITKEQFNSVCASIGRIVIAFANIENTLDAIVASIYQQLDGKSISPELPTNLSRKLVFIKTSLKKFSELKELRNEGIEILGAIKTESSIRNNCLHGYFSGFNSETLTAKFTLLDSYINKQMHTQVDHTYTMEELLFTGKRMLDLGIRINRYADRLNVWIQVQNRAN